MRAPRVACVGGCHVDVKAVVAGSLTPGTSNPVRTTRTAGGVACNVARWLARLGVEVELHSMVGDDGSGAELISRLGAEGVDVTGVGTVSGASTATYTAVLDASGDLAVGLADMGLYDRMDARWASAVLTGTTASHLVIDANPTEQAIAAIAALKGDRWLGADPVSVHKALRLRGVLERIDAVFPDAAEAEVLGGVAGPDRSAAAITALGATSAIVTVGRQGVVVADPLGVRARPAVVPSRVIDVTGAGDALVAGFVYATVAGESDAVGWGLAAASLAVETDASVPDGITVDAIRGRLP